MLTAFVNRSTETEYLDNFQGDRPALKQVLDDINNVNRLLGGNQITIRAVAKLIRAHPKKHYTLIDVGCADGSMLRSLAKYTRKMELQVDLIGIDLNTDALTIAKEASKGFPEIHYLERDIMQLGGVDLECDILISTLTAHHFTDADLLVLLQQFVRLAAIGVVVNDLHRSRWAFYLFQLFSTIFVKTETAKKDGLTSIRRGFKKNDLIRFSKQLHNMHHFIQWKWAFRYVWIMQPIRTRAL